jgi:uncharacterized protein YjbI with pentapeptide repeats
MHIVEPTAENSKTYFLCRCGEAVSILETTAEPVVATICPACNRSHVCAVSAGSVLCQCSVVFNPKSRSIISAGRLKSVTCGKCSRIVVADGQSSVVVCSCGTGLYLGQMVQTISDEFSQTQASNLHVVLPVQPPPKEDSWTNEFPITFEKPYEDGQGMPIDSNGFKGVLGIPGRYEAIQSDLANGVWLDLSRTNLYGFDFKGLTLQSHDMSYSLLQKAHFEETKISFVSFAHSDLRGAHFRGSECYTSFQYSNMIYADFSFAKLAGSDLKCANLGNANLTKADFTGTVLVSTNFVGAVIDGTRFDELSLSTAKIYNPTVDFSRTIVEK